MRELISSIQPNYKIWYASLDLRLNTTLNNGRGEVLTSNKIILYSDVRA